MNGKPTAAQIVRDVMTTDVVTASPDWTVGRIAETMIRQRLRAIPVLDEAGHVLGVVTDRMVMGHFVPHLDRDEAQPSAGALENVPVRDVMERSVMCVKEDDDLPGVAGLMLDKEIERLPVVRGGILVGFLTRGDIIRRFLGDRLSGIVERKEQG